MVFSFYHRFFDYPLLFVVFPPDFIQYLQKVEGRVASDEDLKLSDTLRYYMRDTAAAKRLLFRRLKALHAYETANRILEKARAKNKDVHAVSIIQFRIKINKF